MAFFDNFWLISGQAKTAIQAEIDAAAEMVDFFRFNAFFGKELLKYQPISEDPNTTLNLMRCLIKYVLLYCLYYLLLSSSKQ